MTYSKGQTINLDLGNGNHDYLVLKANGSIIELLCLYTVTEREFGNSQTYFGSIIDNWLENNFYKSLSLEAQSAIIFTPITQYSYAYNSSIFSPTTHVGGAVLKLAKK